MTLFFDIGEIGLDSAVEAVESKDPALWLIRGILGSPQLGYGVGGLHTEPRERYCPAMDPRGHGRKQGMDARFNALERKANQLTDVVFDLVERTARMEDVLLGPRRSPDNGHALAT